MTDQEFETITLAIKAAYPNSNVLPDKYAMKIWFRALNDLDFNVAENAVWEHICTNIFPPNIAEIRKLCMERIKSPVLSFDEAWGVVQRAISNYGWQHPQQAFGTMDELTLSVVKNLGWSRLCQSENPTADRANFREAYEARAKLIQNDSQLPEFVARQKALLQEKYIPVLENNEVRQIEQVESVHDVRETLTEEQIAKRASMLDEARRRIMGG